MSPLTKSIRAWDIETVLAAEQNTTSLTAVDIPGLALDLPANSLWEVWAMMELNSSSVAGAKVAANSPSGATFSLICAGESNAAFPGTAIHANATLSAQTYATVGSGNDIVAYLFGFVKIASTSGLIQMQYAKVTSGTLICRAGARMRASRIT